MTKLYPYILKNNNLVDIDSSGIGLDHAGLCFGYGVFETVLVLNHRPILLNEHINRLKNSAQFLGLNLMGLINNIDVKVKSLIETNNCKDARLNIYCVAGRRGVGNNSFAFSEVDLFVVCRSVYTKL